MAGGGGEGGGQRASAGGKVNPPRRARSRRASETQAWLQLQAAREGGGVGNPGGKGARLRVRVGSQDGGPARSGPRAP